MFQNATIENDKFLLKKKMTTTLVSRINLLDLPKDVRLLIYRFAGAVKQCAIDLNHRRSPYEAPDEGIMQFWGHDRPCVSHAGWSDTVHNLPLDQRPECDTKPLPYQLLYVCRVISAELSHMIYSKNSFVVTRSFPGGLLLLERLRPESIAALTDLAIRLNVCHRPQSTPRTPGLHFIELRPGREIAYCSSDSCERCPEDPYDKPLKMISREHKRAISQWKALAQYLGAHIEPHRLQLTFIADTNEYATAAEVLTSLQSISKLKSCALRLSDKREIRQLANSTAHEITGGREMILPAPGFTDLPHELQVQIWECTELVADHDLSWTPGTGFRCVKPNGYVNNCKLCTAVSRTGLGVITRPHCRPPAARAVINQCDCWSFPSGLFLVNKQLHKEARRIFYSKNHFVLRINQTFGDGAHWKRIEDSRQSSLALLSTMARGDVKFLRSIQFVFPDSAWALKLEECEELWEKGIEVLYQEARLSQVHVAVDFYLQDADQYDDMHSPESLRQSLQLQLDLAQKQVVTPMALLRGPLKIFEVFLALKLEYRARCKRMGLFEEELVRFDGGLPPYEKKSQMEMMSKTRLSGDGTDGNGSRTQRYTCGVYGPDYKPLELLS
ncbi:hypothetical protein EJ08DRAFT_370124 [Tothia fuscella]|uniref:Uncharacterized protein n=1 Tax=Tothia fuscella TaxID=1048955 RepID=A0A9P4NM74_9PEZI|nr:hypothetical protein EJ08DRAFT_370124 [Tothia fuscella]